MESVLVTGNKSFTLNLFWVRLNLPLSMLKTTYHINAATCFQVCYSSLSTKCALKVYAQPIGIALGLLFLTLAVSVFAWRHRFDFKFFLVRFVIKRKQSQEIEDRRTFVIYGEEDYDWVRNVFMPELDGEDAAASGIIQNDSFSLRVGKHNFEPGKPIIENISSKLDSSFKVLLVLTKNMVKSNWCDF